MELIQVGDVYFVRDGHHRISVARALGQWDIEAEVTVWQVTGPLPWEKPATVPGVAGQEVGMERRYGARTMTPPGFRSASCRASATSWLRCG